MVQRQTSGLLTVSTSPDFAAKWLVHRLGRFSDLHPEIDLRVSATMHHVDFAREDVDLAVRHGNGDWSGLDVVPLCTEKLFPVCAPKLVSGRNRIAKAADVLKFPLLRLDDTAWPRWFEAAGVTKGVAQGPIFNRASMLIDAAVDGQGIALARTALAAWDLINGRLIIPVDVSLKMSELVLDCLSKRHDGAAKKQDLPRVASERGRRRCAALEVLRVSLKHPLLWKPIQCRCVWCMSGVWGCEWLIRPC